MKVIDVINKLKNVGFVETGYMTFAKGNSTISIAEERDDDASADLIRAARMVIEAEGCIFGNPAAVTR